MPAPHDAANPTKKALCAWCVDPVAANNGANVDTEPSINLIMQVELFAIHIGRRFLLLLVFDMA